MMQALLTSRPDATLLSEPAVVMFTGYEVNCRHEQAVRFRNLSNLGKRIRSETLQFPILSGVAPECTNNCFRRSVVLQMVSSAGPPTLLHAPAPPWGTLREQPLAKPAKPLLQGPATCDTVLHRVLPSLPHLV